MAERTRDATRARVVARRALVLLTVTLAALLPSATDGAGALVLPSVVTPVAGTGISGYDTGEGGVATTARFAAPVAVATPAGELVVADGDNCRVRRIDAGGIVSDLAGDGTCGFAGDGGPAIGARFDHPRGLARHTDGTLLVADTGNCRIRRIDAAGTISTVAGTGTCDDTGDGGPATDAALDHPEAVAVSATGEVLIADTASCRVRRIDTAGTITTVAGDGTCGDSGDGAPGRRAQLDHPAGVAFDALGRAVIADTGNHRIRRVGTGGHIQALAGSGAPDPQGLHTPRGMTTDVGGRLYVADAGSCRVLSIAGTTLRTVAGSSCGDANDRVPPIAAQFGAPAHVDVTPGGDVVISDTATARVSIVERVALRDATTASAHTSLVEAWRDYGNANAGPASWTGGDATYSLRIPDGRVLWVFADSFFSRGVPGGAGWVEPDHRRIGGDAAVGNQLVVMDPRTTPPTMVNVWRPGAVGQDVFVRADADHRWWPFMPFLKNASTVVIPMVSFDQTRGIVDAFGVTEVDLPTMTVGAPVIVPEGLIDNPRATDGCAQYIDHGDTVLVNPDGSGFTYLYGTEVCDGSGALHLHLARVPGRLLDRQPWQYFAGVDGSGAPLWSSDPADSARLRRAGGGEIADGGYEYTVTPTPSGYRMLHHRDRFGGDIVASFAAAPWGPFGAPTAIYQPPEQGRPTYNNLSPGCALWTYGAKEHVAFSNPSEIVISYNVSVSDAPSATCAGWTGLFELVNNVDNYRPRFVRIPVVAGVPLPAP
ncbi:MAG: hypothetical protein KDB36_13105 [Acidimicrobiales bacterium]|nr:hypothetical protein [Acidimicrobiales bacterium]